MMKRVLSLWEWLTIPWVEISDAETYRQAQILAALALVVLLVSVLISIVMLPIKWGNNATRMLPIWIGMALFVVPYVLSRRGYVRACIYFGGGLACGLIILASVLIGGTAGNENLNFLITVCILASSMLSVRAAAGVTVGYSILIMLIGPGALGISALEVFTGPVVFNLVAGIFAMMIIFSLRRKEARSRAALEQSERRYRLISELSSDFTYYHRVKPDGSYTREWVSDAFERITDYRIEELPHDYTTLIYDPGDLARVYADREQVLAGKPTYGEYRFVRRDGSTRWVSIKRVPDWDAQHRHLVGYYGVVEDITDRKAAEEQKWQLLLRREQFATLQELIEAISHDFRTRLSTLEASRHLLGKLYEINAPREMFAFRLEMIQNAIMQMSAQLSNLSMISSVSNLHLKTVNANDLADRLYTRTAESALGKGVEYTIHLAESALQVNADEPKLETALDHLIANAVAHTSVGGRIWLATRTDGRIVEIEVGDTGTGIASDQIERIFKPFQKADNARTASRAGVGLGLTIAKMIVEAHKGQIQVKSQVGVGSQFIIALPRKNADGPAAVTSAPV